MRSAPHELQAGEAFGRYELLVPIAKGGMSRVWAARLRGTRGFQKLVAIKTLVAEGPNREMLERMLLAEARLAAQIHHPNIAQYLDLGERDGVLFVVMEWVDGESLSVLLKQAARTGGMPLRIAAQILAQTCHGLHFAHELKDDAGESLGLVHCDVSPHNVMIGNTGGVKVIDFGIAKARTGAPMDNDGMVAGKLAFMAPEQARVGAKIDRRADVFSLGILAYQLTTGRHPFGAGTPAETLQRVMRNAPVIPPCAADPSYPRALDRLVMKALSHHPDDRFSSALEMMYQLVSAVPDRAHELEVADFMQQLCSGSLLERRAQVNDALKGAAAREEGSPRAPLVSVTDTPVPRETQAPNSVSTAAPSASSVIVDAPAPARRKSASTIFVLSACAALGLTALHGPIARSLHDNWGAGARDLRGVAAGTSLPAPTAAVPSANAAEPTPASEASAAPEEANAPAIAESAAIPEGEAAAAGGALLAPAAKKRKKPAAKAKPETKPATTPPKPTPPISEKYGI